MDYSIGFIGNNVYYVFQGVFLSKKNGMLSVNKIPEQVTWIWLL